MTSKGSKEGTKQAHFIAAISPGKGFVCVEQYFQKMSGQLFSDFVDEHFETVFENSSKKKARRFLQDGCPSQIQRKLLLPLIKPMRNYFQYHQEVQI